MTQLPEQKIGVPTVVTRGLVKGDEVGSVFGQNGPKPIGAVERFIVPLDGNGLRDELKKCLSIWKEKDNVEFKGDLANQFSRAIYELSVGKKGGQLNVASANATLVMMKDDEGIVVEIRRPEEAYLRGKVIMPTELQSLLEVPLLEVNVGHPSEGTP